MKKKIFILMNYAIAIAMFVFLFKNIEVKDFMLTLKSANLGYLALAVVVSVMFRLFLYPILWKKVLDFSKLDVNYAELFKINAVSLSMKYVLPFKVSEIVRAAGLRIFASMDFCTALSSSVFVRLIITLGTVILLVTGMFLTNNFNYLPWVLIGLLGMVLLMNNIQKLKNIPIANNIINSLIYCFERIKSTNRIKLIVFSVFMQSGEILSSFLIFKAIGLNLSLVNTVYYISIIMLVSSIPISIQGIGIRETTAVMSLSKFAEASVCFSGGILITLIHHLIPAIIGGIIWLISSSERFFTNTVIAETVGNFGEKV
ncbi:MAG: hypothetical protein A2252_05985 [Elusimicrobia bacterium RIFOXYA2_FULL_39_19]|nr:MAG: hypothetical protein A2252_05985 [Elusimicrobia bacterium RIFOXYA2_FULL_39_19]